MFGKFKFRGDDTDINEVSSPASTKSDLSSPIINPARNTGSGNSLNPVKDIRTTEEIDSSVTSIISALLSAVLALVVLMLMVFIVQAIKRRRRERQGTLLNQPVIHAIAPPAFAPNTAAFTSRSGLASSRYMTWENVTQSSAPVIRPVVRVQIQDEDLEEEDEGQHRKNTPSNSNSNSNSNTDTDNCSLAIASPSSSSLSASSLNNMLSSQSSQTPSSSSSS